MLCIWYISIPCSILAIIFGILGRKKGGKGMGTAGLVLGIITVAFLIIIYILFVAGIATMFSVLKDIDYNKIDSENILQAINSINANIINQIENVDLKINNLSESFDKKIKNIDFELTAKINKLENANKKLFFLCISLPIASFLLIILLNYLKII